MGFPSHPPVRARPPGLRAIVAVLVCSAVVVLGFPGKARAEPAANGRRTTASTWVRPVAGRVVRGFVEPANPYAPGHRGADLAAAPGAPVRAAGSGTVSFAGDVAGTLHRC